MLRKLTPAIVEAGKAMLAEKRVTVGVADVTNVLYSEACAANGSDWVKVCIADAHTRVVRIEKNGTLIFQADENTSGRPPSSAFTRPPVRTLPLC